MKFIFGTFGFIIAVALYKQFDFENWSIENPALSLVYSFALAISIYAVIKASKKEVEK